MRLDDASSHGFCILLDFPVNGGFVVEVPTLKQVSTRGRSLLKMELLGGGVSSRQAGFEQEGCGIFFFFRRHQLIRLKLSHLLGIEPET